MIAVKKGYELYFNCQCQPSAEYTVLLETGGGATSDAWILVQPLLAADARFNVCSYDRAGLGRSDRFTGTYNMPREIEALNTALSEMHLDQNILLVGHSYGGFLVRAFAHTYPQKVRGLVYVDPNSVFFFEKHPEIIRDMESSRITIGDRLKGLLVKLTPAKSIHKQAIKHFPKLAAVPPNQVKEFMKLANSRKHLESWTEVGKAWSATLEYQGSFENPDIPTLLITRGQRDTMYPWTNEERENSWLTGQLELLKGVNHARQIMAQQSGHAVNFEQPELIVEGVRELIAENQRKAWKVLKW